MWWGSFDLMRGCYFFIWWWWRSGDWGLVVLFFFFVFFVCCFSVVRVKMGVLFGRVERLGVGSSVLVGLKKYGGGWWWWKEVGLCGEDVYFNVVRRKFVIGKIMLFVIGKEGCCIDWLIDCCVWKCIFVDWMFEGCCIFWLVLLLLL